MEQAEIAIETQSKTGVLHFKSLTCAYLSIYRRSDLHHVQVNDRLCIHLHGLQIKPKEINYRNYWQERNNEKKRVVLEDAKESSGNNTESLRIA